MCGKLSLSLTGNSADSSAGRGLVLLPLICCRHMRDIKILPLWLRSIWWIVTRQNTPSRSAPGGKPPPPPLFFYRQHRARLLWNHVKSQHNFYVIVDHGGNTPFTIPWYGLTQWPTESKSDPAGILQQGRTQLTRLRVNHPCVAVAAIQAGQEGSGAQCQTSWHPHRHTIGCDRRELTTRDCEWREWRRRPAGLIWAGKICFLSPRRVSRTTELRSQLNTV